MALSPLVRQIDHCPDLFGLVDAYPERYPFLLENSGTSSPLGRYDILFAFPGSELILQANGCLELDGVVVENAGFIDELNRIFSENSIFESPGHENELPFTGGWFLYLGYELAEEIEPVLHGRLHTPELPRAIMREIPAGIVRDRQTGKDFLFARGAQGNDLAMQIMADIESLNSMGPSHSNSSGCELYEEEGRSFISNVKRIKDYIRAGDVFQVNLSRRWEAICDSTENELSTGDAWKRLRRSNPSPFAAYAAINDSTTILSSSPERLVSCRSGMVSTRPIAGTYPRSKNHEQDNRLSAELLIHPKERAEHIMLVDLERNDLGRICTPGSIRVDELMVLESYAHVHHIVSGISGRVEPHVLPGDIIRAVFPGGTITGCPKVRCMEIIAELELEARDAYTGSVGYLCDNGDMDLNILIRTITCTQGRFVFRAGAGIVADSDPERELAETRSKARGLYRIFPDMQEETRHEH